VQQKSKEQKMQAAMAGGKGKKKKWSKGKQRDKVASKIFFDDDLYERVIQEVPKVRRAPLSLAPHTVHVSHVKNPPPRPQMKLVTPSALVERFKISGSLARKTINQLADDEVILMVARNAHQWIYTRNVADDASE